MKIISLHHQLTMMHVASSGLANIHVRRRRNKWIRVREVQELLDPLGSTSRSAGQSKACLCRHIMIFVCREGLPFFIDKSLRCG